MYDADGNLTFDGIWMYEWDAENRLISMSMNNIYGIANSNMLQLTFAYDYMNRRISKTVWTNNGSGFVPQSTNYFIYDGWNLIAIFTPSSAIEQSFVWGLDLSGILDQAGGVGGLLAIANSGTNYFTSYDGNGNITGLINGKDKSTSGRYEYGPFGEVIRATGPMAKLSPACWCDKIGDPETGFVYYGYRFYNPSTGRWLSRDPAGEDAGELNLYGFVCNGPVNDVDYLGLMQQQWIIDQVNALDAAIRSQTCCCTKPGISKVAETITGKASGTVVTGNATVEVQGCVENDIAYYWWTCYDAAAERNPWLHSDWKNYGWSAGGSSYSESESPNFWCGLLGAFDPYHLAMDSMVSYTYCGPDGHRHATYRTSNELMFTWNKKTKSWTGP